MPITKQQSWPDGTKPVVSICCITYNHRDSISEAIEGFLMQETTFPVEIIIHDDASADGTSAIIRDYLSRYPKLIRAILQTENQYSIGKPPLIYTCKMAKGEFIAVCEGDDYWISRDKLAKQVALLESNPHCSMCAAQTLVKDDDAQPGKNEVLLQGLAKKFLCFEDFFHRCYLHTSTYLIRSSMLDIASQWSKYIKMSDTSLRYLLSDLGPVVFLPDVVSVYRITGQGIWTSLSPMVKREQEIQLNLSFYTHFKKQYRRSFSRRLLEQYFDILCFSLRTNKFRCPPVYILGLVKHALFNPIHAFIVPVKYLRSYFNRRLTSRHISSISN